MSYLLGTRREKRAMLGGPFQWGPGRADFSATSVVPPPSMAPISAEASLQKVAIWGCVNLTATAADMLPLDVFDTSDSSRQVDMPVWMQDLAGDGHGLSDWASQFVYSGMLRGNVFAPILERAPGRGTPTQLPLAHPDDVRPTNKGWRIGSTDYSFDEVWHKRFYPVPGSRLGMSPVMAHALTIGLGLDSLQFGASWFRDGAIPSSLLTTDQLLDKKKADEAKSRWMATMRGRREPAVLGGGWRWQQVSVNPNESQFLETNKYTAAECCRIFGPAYAEVLGYETGGSMTYSNREQRTLDLLVYSLDPWLVRIERALSALLPAPHVAKFNRGALLRTDLLTRFKAHNIAIASQFETRDEVRDLEDMPPLTEAQKADIASTVGQVPFDLIGAKK